MRTTTPPPATSRDRRLGWPLLPREHGVWAMIVAPWLLALGLVGPSWRHGVLLGAALAGYLAVSALLSYLRTAPARRSARPLLWAAIYAGIGVALAIPVVIARPLVLVAVGGAALAFPVELYYLRGRDERALANGIASIVALTLSGPAALWISAPRVDLRLGLLWLSCLAFFLLSLLFVRSRIRARKSRAFATVSWALHLLLPAALAALGPILLAVALVPALVRLALTQGRALSPKAIGLIELGNVLAFVALAVLALRPLGG